MKSGVSHSGPHVRQIRLDLFYLSIMWPLIVFGFISVSLILLVIFDVRKPKGYPPGPIWLPLVGCYPSWRKLHKKMTYFHQAGKALHEIYGPVVGLKLGFDRVVLVSGYEGFKEVCCNETFDGRPYGLFYRLRSFGERLGIVFIDGPFRQEQNKFSLNLLRKLGFGSPKMHDIIMRESQEFAKIIETKCEKPFRVNKLLDVHTLNVIWTLLAGYRFSSSDEKLLKLLELIHEAFRISEISGGVINQLPFLKYVAPSFSGYNALEAFIDEMMGFLLNIVDNHRSRDDQNFITNFLQKIKENEGIEDTSFTKKQLLVLLQDLFMTGTETTSNTLVFILYYLIKNPEVQKKIHAELDRELGVEEMPTLNHRNRLVYLEATIMESQRMCSLVPQTLPHRALHEEKLMGYDIPQDTILLPCIWSVHMDEKYWEDPHVFRPDRFVDENGEINQHSGHFVPYGIGRRKCLGENVAKATLFQFVAVLLKKFELKSPDDNFEVDINEGMTLSLSSFEITFASRSKGECSKIG